MAVIQALTNITLVRNTGTVCTAVATAADTTTLVCTPTKGTNKLVIILFNSAAGAVTVDIAKGDYWAGKAMTQVSLAQNVPRAFVFESARFAKAVSAAADTITLTVAAAAVTTSYMCLELP